VIETVRTGRVLRVVLNRPEKRNALSVELCRAIAETVEAAANDPSVGAIVLAANGPSFCAGMDLAELGSVPYSQVDRVHDQLFTLGARLAKPLIAAVQGPALGGGTGLVANCHIVIASEAATFGLTEIRLGMWPFLIYGAMAAALGERRTMEMALTGRIFNAMEAKEIGLVHEVVADAGERAAEVAETVAGYSPSSVRSGLLFVQEVRDRGAKNAGEIARMMRKGVFESEDFVEGVRAFREKRPARWPSLEKASGKI
jgi:enoyl-CoA hydratase/carnithine racemase